MSKGVHQRCVLFIFESMEQAEGRLIWEHIKSSDFNGRKRDSSACLCGILMRGKHDLLYGVTLSSLSTGYATRVTYSQGSAKLEYDGWVQTRDLGLYEVLYTTHTPLRDPQTYDTIRYQMPLALHMCMHAVWEDLRILVSDKSSRPTTVGRPFVVWHQ